MTMNDNLDIQEKENEERQNRRMTKGNRWDKQIKCFIFICLTGFSLYKIQNNYGCLFYTVILRNVSLS